MAVIGSHWRCCRCCSYVDAGNYSHNDDDDDDEQRRPVELSGGTVPDGGGVGPWLLMNLVPIVLSRLLLRTQEKHRSFHPRTRLCLQPEGIVQV